MFVKTINTRKTNPHIMKDNWYWYTFVWFWNANIWHLYDFLSPLDILIMTAKTWHYYSFYICWHLPDVGVAVCSGTQCEMNIFFFIYLKSREVTRLELEYNSIGLQIRNISGRVANIFYQLALLFFSLSEGC